MRRTAALLALCTCLVPSAAAAQTLVVDDQDGAPHFTTTGDDWTTWGMNGHGLDAADTSYHYLSHTLGGPDRRGTATWSPDLPTAGLWRIETWFRRTENRSSDADHIVHDGEGGRTRVVLDQRGDGASGWVLLGDYPCAAGRGGCRVVLDGTDDDESDEANAVRFTLLEEAPPPEEPPPPTDDDDSAEPEGDDDDSGIDADDDDSAVGEPGPSSGEVRPAAPPSESECSGCSQEVGSPLLALLVPLGLGRRRRA